MNTKLARSSLPFIIALAIGPSLMAGCFKRLSSNRNENGPIPRSSIDFPREKFVGVPQRMEEEEGGYTAVWTLYPSGEHYEAKWSNGAVANLAITKWDSEGVRIVRTDNSESVSKNFTAIYTGKISGNSISGDVKFTQNGQSWEGTWSATWSNSNP